MKYFREETLAVDLCLQEKDRFRIVRNVSGSTGISGIFEVSALEEEPAMRSRNVKSGHASLHWRKLEVQMRKLWMLHGVLVYTKVLIVSARSL